MACDVTAQGWCAASRAWSVLSGRVSLSLQVNYWHSDQCNMINGTSGQMWAPFMTPETSLEFYSPEACR